MTSISVALRRLVIQRSDDRCEYCGLSQAGQVATFHIDHILPEVLGGKTTSDNLALACVSCSLRKGARRLIMDPVTDQMVSIFHPRQQI
jgi:5-methylcytosine-specific restriction endonuclease McrA